MSDSHQGHAAGCGHQARPGWGWIFFAFLLMAVVLLWEEHRAHILGVIPYLFLLACPLIHLLHGHGHRRNTDHEEGHHA